MKINAWMMVAAFAIPTIASADDTKKTETAKLEAEDLEIVVHHSHMNLKEADLGKLAQKRGTAKVKDYGAMLVKEHVAANKALIKFANNKGITKIPKEIPKTDEEKSKQGELKATMTRLGTLRGAEFDREFLPMIVIDHEAEVARIDAAIGTAKDPDLVTLLQDARPTLQRHADTARELQKSTAVSAK